MSEARYSIAQLPGDYFDLIPQAAVRYSNFPDKLPHNAIWDFGRGPGKTMYAALCGELSTSVCVRLYEYLPTSGELRFCFDGRPVTMTNRRVIPPSKVHTSLHPTRDGTLIMATHTTAKSPAHPHWLFDSYYTHVWEGYAGSHLLVWNPRTQEVQSLGTPSPRDSIYGGIYDDRHHAFWFTTYLKGHLHRLDLTTRELRDFGQITEYGSYCLCKDRLGHLYTASRTGHVIRIDVDTCQITDLGVFAREPEANPMWKTQRIIGHHAHGPDGRLYLSFRFSDYLYAIDPQTLKVERTASFLLPGYESAPPAGQKGLAFDSKGALWSVTMRPVNSLVGNLCHLQRWDLLGGGKPECVGLLGTPARATACVSELLMDEDDVLHIADSNHGDDPPGILAVDTRKLTPGQPRVKTHDAAAYLLFADGERACPDPEYRQNAEKARKFVHECEEFQRFVKEEANTAIRAQAATAVRLWEVLGRGKAAVAAMRWADDGSLFAWCGPGGACRLRIRDGSVVERVDAVTDCPPPEAGPPELTAARLPSRQGRQYLATPSCWAPWRDGQWLIGTRDSLVARFDERTGQTFSLGAVGVHGPVHQIVTDATQSIAFGVSGDPQDLGHVFHYSDQSGLREVGRTLSLPGQIVYSNTQPTTVALSLDGRDLAVGVSDDLACIYLYRGVFVGA